MSTSPRRMGVLAPSGDTAAMAAALRGHSLRPSVVFSAPRLHVTVGGCAAFYAAELTCAPEHAVTLAPSNVPTSLRVSPSLHVFTRANWATPQLFRVAAVCGAAWDDAGHASRDAPRAFVQLIEHTGSSLDARFHGARLLFLPGAIAVHVSPRDGSVVLASGRALATAAQLGKGVACEVHHGFRPLHVDRGARSSSSSALAVNVARSSMVAASPGSAAAMAAVDAANSAVARRLTVARRSVVVDVSSATRDAPSFVKVACRKLQTVLLQRSGAALALGKREGGGGPDGGVATLTDAACGDDHVVATTEHGQLLAWGDARDGRLGLSPDDAPVLRALLHKRVVQVACGARHALALAEDGDVFAWGYGKSGALGLATSAQSKAPVESVPTPMEVLTLKQRGVATLACGDLHSAVVLASGALLTCGWAEHGRLGRPVEGECSGCFARVDLRGRLCTFVACGGAHTLALTACHSVVAFGANASGQLGVGDCRARAKPTRVAYFEGDAPGSAEPLVVTSIAAGKAHSVAVTLDARVFAWGSDEFGQCGVGAFPQLYTVPHLVASAVGLGATQAACGDAHSVLLAHTSPQQLEALEAAHPARFAQLLDRYERVVREDRQRRSAVLLRAKQREHAHEAAARQRKPPLDPSLPRGPAWQRALNDAAARADAIVETATPATCQVRRPQTANASLASALAREKSRERGAKTRPSTGLARARPPTATPDASHQKASGKVRCSSATLWRQTRLFTFPAPQAPPDTPAEAPETPPTSRPPSRPGHPLKLTTQARQTLGRIFHGDAATTGTDSKEAAAGSDDNQLKVDHVASATAAAFSATRPKSAPSRAAVTSSTRAS